MSTPPRVVAIADADSYVKWAAALIDEVHGIRPHLVIVRTPLIVSEQQQRAALAGTSFGADAVTRLGHRELAAWLDAEAPDVVVIGGRGPFVRLIQRVIDTLEKRPVIVTGLPGISIPAQRGALLYRRFSDLMLVQSRRELRAFTELARRLSVSVEFALATLPYAQPHATTGGSDLVFAAQAIVPRERADRMRVADLLRRAALADPSRRVVVKLRSQRAHGETETHFERDSYEDLLAQRPDNLVFSYTPMAQALDTAEGLVTISSTAAIEAIARDIPVIALDTFGVRKTHLNTVFGDSGLLGSEQDVIARRFRHPDAEWKRENYFHAPAESDWWSRVEELLAARRRGVLAARPVPALRGGALHEAWQRKSVLGHEDRTFSGAVALVVGRPLVWAILALRRLRGRRGRDTWLDESSEITLTPALHQDPILRSRRSLALVD